MKILPLIFLLIVVPLMSYCQDYQAQSLAGRPLMSPSVDQKIIRKTDSTIQVIRSKSTLSEDDFIEIGKQLVAEAKYKEAVANYSEGLARFPKSFKLLRYRGHRYLTLRKLDLASIDLLKARELTQSQPDAWEVDANGNPTDTYQHQIEYHLGVFYFLKKDYKNAVHAFELSLKNAHAANEIVGTTDWLYSSYRYNNQKSEAEKLLNDFKPDAKADKDQAYFRRIQLYKGTIQPNEILDETKSPDQWSVQEVTRAFGLANWYTWQGDKKKARELYTKILNANNAWPAFAYLGSEVEMLK